MYRDPRRPHSYLECRVRDDRDLYPRPHITHRNRSSPLPPPAETYSVEGLTASIQGGFFTSRGFLPHARNASPFRDFLLSLFLFPSLSPSYSTNYKNTLRSIAACFPTLSLFFFHWTTDGEEKARTKRVNNTESSSLQMKTAHKAPLSKEQDRPISVVFLSQSLSNYSNI